MCSRLPESGYSSFKHLDLLFSLPRPIRLIIIYPPPSKSSSDFLDEFAKLIEAVVLSAASFLIVGDFNYNVNCLSDPSAWNFFYLNESHWFLQYVTSPTHMHGHTLDLVIARAADNPMYDVSTGSFLSNHTFVFCSFRSCLPPSPTKHFTFRSYKSFSLDSFLSDLSWNQEWQWQLWANEWNSMMLYLDYETGAWITI